MYIPSQPMWTTKNDVNSEMLVWSLDSSPTGCVAPCGDRQKKTRPKEEIEEASPLATSEDATIEAAALSDVIRAGKSSRADPFASSNAAQVPLAVLSSRISNPSRYRPVHEFVTIALVDAARAIRVPKLLALLHSLPLDNTSCRHWFS
jgi:hypothetical protein